MEIHAYKWSSRTLALFVVVLIGPFFLLKAQVSDFLKYTLKAKPGDLTVNIMPTTDPHPKSYKESFTFTVTNPTRTDFKGSAPTTQIFDVEVFSVGLDHPTSVWKWSTGMKFGDVVTPVSIPAGQSWTPSEKVIWSFKGSDVKEGKYFAVATFIPTGNKKAIANFTIKVVQ